MNAIVTLNLRNFMPACARASFQHAAKRWAVEYIEIVEPLGQVHHFWQKAILSSSKHVTGIDRILQLDGDILIRSDCPSPFDLVPRENFGVVSRVQQGISRRRFETRRHLMASRMGLAAYSDPKQHLNAGLILYDRMFHERILSDWVTVGARCSWSTECNVPEQFALSCLLQATATAVTWLPATYNFLLAQRQPTGPMHAFVYHYNARGKRKVADLMERHQWQLQ
jgi:hypothetical protein